MAKTRTDDGTEGIEATPAPSSQIIFALGVGGAGKSTTLRTIIEARQESGRRFRKWDLDPANKSGPQLAKYFDDVEAPPSLGDEDRCVWLEGKIIELAKAIDRGEPTSAVVDIGPDDSLLPQLSREVRLVHLLDRLGIEPVALHVIGAAERDLRYLKLVEGWIEENGKLVQKPDVAGLFKPRRVVVVLNGGRLTSSQDPMAIFELQIDRVLALFPEADRQPLIVFFPKLNCMTRVEDDALRAGWRTFRETAAQALGNDREWIMDATRVGTWFDTEVPKFLAPLNGLLP